MAVGFGFESGLFPISFVLVAGSVVHLVVCKTGNHTLFAILQESLRSLELLDKQNYGTFDARLSVDLDLCGGFVQVCTKCGRRRYFRAMRVEA